MLECILLYQVMYMRSVENGFLNIQHTCNEIVHTLYCMCELLYTINIRNDILFDANEHLQPLLPRRNRPVTI